MKHALVGIVAFALVLLGSASPATAGGINLAWDDCGSFGACNQSFACDVNGPGAFVLVGSFVAPAGVTQFVGLEARVDFQSNNLEGTMPDWWRFKTVGSCRMSAVIADANFTFGPFSCIDPWQGQAVGGLAGWSIGTQIGPGYPDHYGRMTLAFALPAEFVGPLDADEHYGAFRVVVNRSRTVGTGACGGCRQPGAFLVSTIKLVQPPGVGDFLMNNWDYEGFATWQNGMFPMYDVAYLCPVVVSTQNRTWGSIKSLYH